MRISGSRSWLAVYRDMVRCRVALGPCAVSYSWDHEPAYKPTTLHITVGSASLTLTARLRRHNT